MRQDTDLLAEMMLQAEVFCTRIEAAAIGRLRKADNDELRLKISQCRGALGTLQGYYEANKLTIDSPAVCANFRQLVMSLLWVTFRAGSIVDRRLFRKLVQIESGFTYLLINSLTGQARNEKRTPVEGQVAPGSGCHLRALGRSDRHYAARETDLLAAVSSPFGDHGCFSREPTRALTALVNVVELICDGDSVYHILLRKTGLLRKRSRQTPRHTAHL